LVRGKILLILSFIKAFQLLNKYFLEFFKGNIVLNRLKAYLIEFNSCLIINYALNLEHEYQNHDVGRSPKRN
jgi:hypothetical protein